jgi:uncharacterized protein with PQ loop repeat
MDGPIILGMVGALIAGYAYIPQITHLVKQRCSEGISRKAFALWFISSTLMTINAIWTQSIAFILLGVIQIAASGTIFIFTNRYRGQVCLYHHVVEKPRED